jgi:hypothetical protein
VCFVTACSVLYDEHYLYEGYTKEEITVPSSENEMSPDQLGNRVEGVEAFLRPPPPLFYSRFLDRFLKTTWTVFLLSWIFASKHHSIETFFLTPDS